MTKRMVEIDDETHIVVPRSPSREMVIAGKEAMPVEYEFRSMQSWGGEEFPHAVRMVVVGLAKQSDQVTPDSVWRAMLDKT